MEPSCCPNRYTASIRPRSWTKNISKILHSIRQPLTSCRQYARRSTHSELNDGLVRSRAEAVQDLDSHVGSGVVEASESNTSRTADDGRGEEDKSSADHVGNGNPPDVDKSL
jgi:hypothetical protein